ncbi:MAG: hypothetical protein ABS56_16240 [Lautropia sp. SCN 69-89]|nr:MAG: hypothetical protein ABS56_16240 [Lautropia sp. SCN 69-89]
MTLDLWIWRHPRPDDAQGRCIGRTDLAVDPRRAARLAYRIATAARRNGLPREVWTSPLRRCADAGRALARLGFAHRIDERLAEFDFGAWDGRRWSDIDRDEFSAWDRDFSGHRPGGGESVTLLMARARSFLHERAAGADPAGALLVVGHAGWINAARLSRPPARGSDWPPIASYASLVRLRFEAQQASSS